MKSIVYLIALMVQVLVAGCSDRHAAVVLPRAAAVMDSVPDSALVWLEGIDGRRLHGAQRAEHALLLTQARYKCYVPQASDSLIGIAVDYYSDRADEYGDQLVKALYYKAEIHNEAGDRTHSLLTAMQAEKTPGFGSDPEFAARVYNLMADLYDRSYMFDLELEYTKRAVNMYAHTDLRTNYLYTLIDEALVKGDLKDYAGSIALLDSVMPLCKDYGNKAVTGACLSAYTRPLRYTGQYERMDSVCRELFKLVNVGDYKPKVDDYVQYSFVKIHHNRSAEEANELLQQAMFICKTDVDTFNIELAKIKLCDFGHNYKESAKRLKDVIEFQDYKIVDILKQSVATTQSNYYQAQADIERAEKNMANIRLFIWVILTIFLILMSLWCIRERRHRYQRELNVLIAAIRNMETDLKNTTANYKISLEKLYSLFSSQFDTLNILCTNYYGTDQMSDRLRLSIYNNVKDELSQISSDVSMLKIEQIVNDCRDNIVTDFKKIYPDSSKEDIQILILLWCGFSPKSVGFITHFNVRTVYTKRRRWKIRFMELQSPYREKFIEALGQGIDL